MTEAAGWSQAMQQYEINRLDLVQTSARSWLGTMTTLLGVFSAVLVVNRGEVLAALPIGDSAKLWLYLAVVAVYLSGFGAVFMAAEATFGGLKPVGHERTGRNQETEADAVHTFRTDRMHRAIKSRAFLHWSRRLGLIALFFAVALALFVLALGGFADEGSDPTYVVVVHDGQVTCGQLELTVDGRTLIGGQELVGVSQLTSVPGC